jgi:hypothetical protein
MIGDDIVEAWDTYHCDGLSSSMASWKDFEAGYRAAMAKAAADVLMLTRERDRLLEINAALMETLERASEELSDAFRAAIKKARGET